MSRVRENQLVQVGLTWMQAGILFILKRSEEPPTPSEISRWLLREPHTISALLDRMEKIDLIRKERDPQRKNVLRVKITEKGEEAYRRIGDVEAVPNLLSCLSQKERRNLTAYSEKLLKVALERLVVKRQWQPPFS